jgi:hypothetical protein
MLLLWHYNNPCASASALCLVRPLLVSILQACLKCLAVCVSLQHLPGLPAAAVSAGKAVSSLLRKVPDAAHPLAQDCFKLLGGTGSLHTG